MKPSLKITFNNKTHLLSKQVQTYDQFLKKVVELYPRELSEGFKLYIAINYGTFCLNEDEDPVLV